MITEIIKLTTSLIDTVISSTILKFLFDIICNRNSRRGRVRYLKDYWDSFCKI